MLFTDNGLRIDIHIGIQTVNAQCQTMHPSRRKSAPHCKRRGRSYYLMIGLAPTRPTAALEWATAAHPPVGTGGTHEKDVF